MQPAKCHHGMPGVAAVVTGKPLAGGGASRSKKLTAPRRQLVLRPAGVTESVSALLTQLQGDY
jgi:hypothetical protein